MTITQVLLWILLGVPLSFARCPRQLAKTGSSECEKGWAASRLEKRTCISKKSPLHGLNSFVEQDKRTSYPAPA